MKIRVLGVQTGLARPLLAGGQSVLSGIHKTAATGAVAVGPMGLSGDEQADLSVHGGLSKAIYAYPHEHYAFWRTVRAQAGAAQWDAPLAHGAMGENLTLEGVLESQLWVGDRLRLPDCVLVVSEPRFPCFKFNAHLGFKHAVKMMAQSAYCGCYFAVLEGGSVAAGEEGELESGPRDVGILELFKARAHKLLN